MEQKFNLGKVVLTRSVVNWAESNTLLYTERDDFMGECLMRHRSGDWGDLDPEDAALNDEALKSGEERLFSSYDIPEKLRKEGGAVKLWIITEWDRSATTILFPEDY